ncbi:MAG: hypothetical protein ACYTG6_17075 [Planctomycetota bacterium]|jgi:hypothetical protein
MQRPAIGCWLLLLAATACTGCRTRLPFEGSEATTASRLEDLAPARPGANIEGRLAWLRGEAGIGDRVGDVTTAPAARATTEEIQGLFRFEQRGRGRSGLGISVGICECRCVPGR